MQGIVAKPLVETLRLKKNRERNPKIRETQRFQESRKMALRRLKMAPRILPAIHTAKKGFLK